MHLGGSFDPGVFAKMLTMAPEVGRNGRTVFLAVILQLNSNLLKNTRSINIKKLKVTG